MEGLALCAEQGIYSVMKIRSLVAFLFAAGSIVAQPILETGQLLKPGELLTEVALGGWPLNHGASGY